jgi:alpha-1,2-mannosyltransferase
VTNVSTSIFLSRFDRKSRSVLRHVIDPAAVLYPFCVKRSYDLIFTSWSCEMPFWGDFVYAQPPTGSLARPVRGCKFSWPRRQHLLGTVVNATGIGITWPLRSLFGLFSLRYHTFVSCSNAVRNFIKYQLGKDSMVIYPPVPVHLYDTKGDFKENIVVSLGRIDPEKRFDLIGVVGPKIPEAKFVLIGGADAAGKKIVEQIEGRFKRAGLGGNFTYLGRVPEHAKRELLLKSKALFHPAPYESFGIAIVEGMAAGAIPIAHNSGGPSEVVPPSWLFTNVDEAVEKLRNSLSEDLSARKKIKEIALKFNEERFKNGMLHVVDRLIVEDTPRSDDRLYGQKYDLDNCQQRESLAI